MQYLSFEYDLRTGSSRAVVRDEETPLTKAVEAEAQKHPDEAIVGVAINDEVKHVGPLE